MKIKRLIVGILDTNCYILTKDDNNLIIDPGDNAELICSNIKGKISGIIITHYHFDHIGALNELVNKFNVNIYDINNLIEGENTIENFTFKVMYTPGHREDCITLLFENIMFSGDFIFEGTIGRTDLETGDFKKMQESIKKILELNDDYIIYPGHGNQTTLKKEIPNLKKYI